MKSYVIFLSFLIGNFSIEKLFKWFEKLHTNTFVLNISFLSVKRFEFHTFFERLFEKNSFEQKVFYSG